MSTIVDQIKPLIIKEFMLEPGLREEFRIAGVPAEIAKAFSPQVGVRQRTV